MATENKTFTEFLELINNYPSPHNGQPFVLRDSGLNTFEVLFDTSRGLTATPISYLFSFVSIGVFMRHLELSAAALGHTVEISLKLPQVDAMAGPGLLHCADVKFTYGTVKPDSALRLAIETRQTSRKKYISGLDAVMQETLIAAAKDYQVGCVFVDQATAYKTIWLNQRAVFDDMFNPAVRKELQHWLRYSQAEKQEKSDGLSYDCMELNGPSMKASVKYYRALHWPVVSGFLRRYYMRTMRDDSSVGYFSAPFKTGQDAYRIGQAVMDCWLELAKAGLYLHPFGTIVSNDAAHNDFAKLVGLDNESRDNYIVFIFRAGASEKPVESLRVPIKRHLYNQA